MSLSSFKEMLYNLEGQYTFDFSKQDDCDFILDEYGGEENMKKNFPQIYEGFIKAKERASKKKEDGTDEDIKILSGGIHSLHIETLKDNKNGANSADEKIGKIASTVKCILVDETKKAASNSPADKWIGVSVQTSITDSISSECIVNKYDVIEATNQYDNIIESNDEYVKDLNNRKYKVCVDLSGFDPSGALNRQFTQNASTVGNSELVSIYNVVVEDPAPKSAKHREKNDEISMLYGRMNEQQIYADADYKGGDYYNNAFSKEENKVHLLMPIKGYVIFNENVEPIGLKKPDSSTVMQRSRVSYDNKEKIIYYRHDLDDNELYDKIKDCFTHEKYIKGAKTNMYFDVKIDDPERSNLDWHGDIEGNSNYTQKELMLECKFNYQVKNQLGVLSEDMFSIVSMDSNFMQKKKLKYYQYVENSNIIYIPPIKIYWGCYAKDTAITMYDGSLKNACDIKAGDLVMGIDNKKLTVEQVLHGKDDSIYLIDTKDHGSIRVSGGHPMMCDGKYKRAHEIKPGDFLNTSDGGLAEVVDVKVVKYDDMVYNFSLEEEEDGAYIIANGFYSGDLKLQNKKIEVTDKPLTPEQLELINEVKLHMKQKENKEHLSKYAV